MTGTWDPWDVHNAQEAPAQGWSCSGHSCGRDYTALSNSRGTFTTLQHCPSCCNALIPTRWGVDAGPPPERNTPR